MNITDLQALLGAGGAPLVAALVTAFVKPWLANDKWYPAAAIVLGTLWNVAIAAALGLALPPAALLGIATGLMASGLYSTAKTLITPNR